MAVRTLAIGDIHGSLKALVQVLDRANYNPKKDNLIFLGDYVDGWSESAEVVDFIIGLKEKIKFENRHPESVVCLEGNHDQWLAEFLIYGTAQPGWLQNGGRTTLASYEKFWDNNGRDSKSLDSHRDFFNKLMPYYITNKNQAFVHAGCSIEDGVGGTLPYLRVWDRQMWAKVMSGATVKAHNELYIGHTTTCSLKLKKHLPEYDTQKDGLDYITVPVNRQNVWNLDTGAGWHGRLTAMDIDSKEFFQSDLSMELYPNEKGRM
ncbi:MAG: metallophosphoesterase family protein [Elainellaceae cyanobacterium]